MKDALENKQSVILTLTRKQIARGITKLEGCLQEIKKAADSASISEYPSGKLYDDKDALNIKTREVLITVLGENSSEFERFKYAWQRNGFYISSTLDTVYDKLKDVKSDYKRYTLHLEGAINLLKDRLEELDEKPLSVALPPQISQVNPTSNKKIFIVHGHDDGAKETVARMLEKLELEPIILHEKANQGKTLIEKFEAHADVGYAVVLLTPDDEGRVKGDAALTPRARQNVILELGYFIGKLGRAGVCALRGEGVEIPSDFQGVVYIDFTLADWKYKLAHELDENGYVIDYSKLK